MVWPPNQMSLSASAPKLKLGDQHRARIVKTLDDDRVRGGDAIPKGLGAIRGGNARGVQKVLRAPWNAMQRSAILAGRDFLIGTLGLGERQFAGKRDDATQLGIELLQTRQVDAG